MVFVGEVGDMVISLPFAVFDEERDVDLSLVVDVEVVLLEVVIIVGSLVA